MASSKHFSDKELACRHCGVNGCRPRLLAALEFLRSEITIARGVSTPVIVNDAYRCSVHNAELPNAAKNSKHVLGDAADFRVAGMSAAELEQYCLRVPLFRGLGRDDLRGYVHGDVREEPEPAARWCYDARGNQVAWYKPVETLPELPAKPFTPSDPA